MQEENPQKLLPVEISLSGREVAILAIVINAVGKMNAYRIQVWENIVEKVRYIYGETV